MKTYPVTIPEMALVAITRGAAGAGLGLLLGGKLRSDTRRAVGWTLLAVGIVTTIPIIGALMGTRRSYRGQSNAQPEAGETPLRAEFGEPPESD